MNRREFLKGGLAGAFGTFLTWAGAVRVEGAQKAKAAKELPVNGKWHLWTIYENDILKQFFVDGMLVKEEKPSPSWPNSEEGTIEDWVWSNQEGVGVLISVDEDKWSQHLEAAIIAERHHQVSDNVSWDHAPETGGPQATDTHRCDQGCDGCPHTDCEAYPVRAVMANQ